jgi:hypothetical protein
LENVNAPFRGDRAKFFCDEVTKCRGPAQSDTATYYRVHGNPTEEERDAWTQSDADENRGRCEASLVRSDQRTTQEPFGGQGLLQLDGNCGTTIRHDPDRGVSLRCDNPEAPDKWAQCVGGLVKSNLRAMDESAANAHPSNWIFGVSA